VRVEVWPGERQLDELAYLLNLRIETTDCVVAHFANGQEHAMVGDLVLRAIGYSWFLGDGAGGEGERGVDIDGDDALLPLSLDFEPDGAD
jgi:hypothetical protein